MSSNLNVIWCFKMVAVMNESVRQKVFLDIGIIVFSMF